MWGKPTRTLGTRAMKADVNVDRSLDHRFSSFSTIYERSLDGEGGLDIDERHDIVGQSLLSGWLRNLLWYVEA